jgi:hypothetical protein
VTITPKKPCQVAPNLHVTGDRTTEANALQTTPTPVRSARRRPGGHHRYAADNITLSIASEVRADNDPIGGFACPIPLFVHGFTTAPNAGWRVRSPLGPKAVQRPPSPTNIVRPRLG